METPKQQLAEISHLKAGKKPVKRLKARHLSALTKRIIVEKFTALESYDDVANEMLIPGLTGRTVSEVLHSITHRKQPGVAQTITGREVPLLVRKATA